MRPAKILQLLAGLLAAVIGLGMTVGGAALVWAHTTQRDDDGYYSTRTERFETPTYALTSEDLHLGGDVGEGDWLPFDVGTARIVATSATGADVFIGIARSDDVERYLARTSHDEVADVHTGPFRVEHERHEGTAAPPLPGEQGFWAAAVQGPGRQAVTWEVEGGEWTAVVMNADASRGVVVDASAGIRTGLLLAVGLGLGGVGFVVLLVAVLLLALALRTDRRPTDPATAPAPPAAPVPPLAGSGTPR